MQINTEVITTFYTAFSKLDHVTMNSCYSDDIVFNDPAFGILRVPSRIRAESGRFRIDEVGGSGPKDRGDDNN